MGAKAGIKFSVASNFDDALIDALEDYPVTDIFGKFTSDRIGGGRASFMFPPLSEGRFRAHVSRALKMGIGFNYLINPACMDNREHTRAGQRDLYRLLEYIDDCGVTCVTLSLPSLLPVVKKRHPGLKVRVGVYARVDGVTKAKFWEDLGADCITLESISVNRDFGTLEGIRKAVKVELQLIANSNCLMFCPLSGQHMVNLSHASQKGHASRGFMIDWCALRCSYERLREPAGYLRSEFIRPEDVKTYADMGYTSFKILERGLPTDIMARRVKAYYEGKFEGNLLELIQPYGLKEKRATGGFWRYFFRPGQVRMSRLMRIKKLAERRGMLAPLEGDPVYLDNGALDGFLEGFRGRDCRSGCGKCGHCEAYAKKAVRVEEKYRAELLKEYAEVFGEMSDGTTWGI